MGYVAIITEDQKDLLVGEKYDGVQLFYPIQDVNNNWCISKEEINSCTIKELDFLKGLELIPHTPIEEER